MMYAYISGPITGTTDYKERFKAAEERVAAKLEPGWRVINPVEECAHLPQDAPWRDYMDVCLSLLKESDAIYMLPGWGGSLGATIEHLYAAGAGLPIYLLEAE